MLPKSYMLFPCAFFFTQSQYRLGLLALLMQLSLVLWPASIRLVRQARQRSGMERLLAEFSDLHYVPADPYNRAANSFRRGGELGSVAK